MPASPDWTRARLFWAHGLKKVAGLYLIRKNYVLPILIVSYSIKDTKKDIITVYRMTEVQSLADANQLGALSPAKCYPG